MWTEITRANYGRDGLRYASDMTDVEWELIEGHLPAAKATYMCLAGPPQTRHCIMASSQFP